MAHNTAQVPQSRTRVCEQCRRKFLQTSQTARLTCDTCRTTSSGLSPKRPASQPGSTSNTIPATYLDLLDSKIAEYEHAAERSESNGRSTNTASSAEKSAKATQSLAYSPYIQHATREASSRNKPTSPSVVMNRFLNDPTEPDGVRDAIYASRMVKSR